MSGLDTNDVETIPEPERVPLYRGHEKVYPKRVRGTFRRVKWAVLVALLGIYYVGPWIRWDRGPGMPDQAILLDLDARRAYFFWIEIWPQELYFLVGLLLMGAIGLFLVTSLAGRVWCGYTCPQTVWTDLFLIVERWIEGDRNARMRLDRQPWTGAKIAKVSAKHAIWLVIALLTGGAWIFYYQNAPTALAELVTGNASTTVYFFLGLFTATTYLLAGWAREQVCTYMCPWPRFQAAMFDEHTLVVSYDEGRGEPRGAHKKGESWEGRGDCIDCGQCVAVCPTGVDIRKGIQLECIGCALCIDACNTVMDKVGRPRELIRYDTPHNQQARAIGLPPRYRLIRPRTIFYSLLLVGISVAMIWGLVFRSSVEVNVLHDRSPLFVTLADGSIRNGYEVKILNMANEERHFTVRYEGLPQARIAANGADVLDDLSLSVPALADDVTVIHLFATAPRSSLSSPATDVTISVTDQVDGETADSRNVFRGPAR